MESTNTKITRKEIIQIVFNILLALAIGALIFSIIVVVKNAEEIRNDPIDYAIKNSNIVSCTCFNDEGLSNIYGKEQNTFSGEIGEIKLAKGK